MLITAGDEHTSKLTVVSQSNSHDVKKHQCCLLLSSVEHSYQCKFALFSRYHQFSVTIELMRDWSYVTWIKQPPPKTVACPVLFAIDSNGTFVSGISATTGFADTTLSTAILPHPYWLDILLKAHWGGPACHKGSSISSFLHCMSRWHSMKETRVW